MKYIDADKLIAEIERRIKLIPLNFVEVSSHPNAEKTNHKLRNGLERALNSIKDFIQSLRQEQPEVDLEKEIGRWMDKLDDKYCILVEDYSIQDIKDTARHFYELGKNAK